MPHDDRTKSYSYSDNFKYISEDDGDLDNIKLLLDSIITRYLSYQYSKNGFDQINIVSMIYKKEGLDDLDVINDDSLCKFYKLTNIEIRHIKKLLG